MLPAWCVVGEEKIVEIATKTGVVEEAKDDAITTEEAGQHEGGGIPYSSSYRLGNIVLDASTPKLSSPTHKTEEDTHEDTDGSSGAWGAAVFFEEEEKAAIILI